MSPTVSDVEAALIGVHGVAITSRVTSSTWLALCNREVKVATLTWSTVTCPDCLDEIRRLGKNLQP